MQIHCLETRSREVSMLQLPSCFLFKPKFKNHCSRSQSGGPRADFENHSSVYDTLSFICLLCSHGSWMKHGVEGNISEQGFK